MRMLKKCKSKKKSNSFSLKMTKAIYDEVDDNDRKCEEHEIEMKREEIFFSLFVVFDFLFLQNYLI